MSEAAPRSGPGGHLQHPPVPRARRPHASRSDRGGAAGDRRRRHRAAGGDRRGRVARGPGAADWRGARHGLGHGAPRGSCAAHAYGNVVLSRFPIVHHVRYDLSWKTCEPRCCQRVDVGRRRPAAAHLQRALRHGNPRAPRAGRTARRASSATGRVAGPKVVLGDFNEWTRGPASALLAERLHGVDLAGAPAPPPHAIRACCRSCTSITSITQARVEVERVELVRTRRTLIASDHLPLVAS